MAMPSNHSKHLVNVGDKFSRLIVLSFSHHDKRWRRHYLVKCDCGNQKTVQGTLLRSGNTKSCGCLAKDIKRKRLLPNNQGVINQIILGYKRHAKGRGFNWNLSFDDVRNIITQPCHYCGSELSNMKITKNCKDGFKYNGIDRINSKKHYTKDNVVPCCAICNTAKNNMSKFDFLLWIERVHNHQKAMVLQWGSQAILKGQKIQLKGKCNALF